MFMYIVKK